MVSDHCECDIPVRSGKENIAVVSISGGKDSAYMASIARYWHDIVIGVMIDTGFMPELAHQNARLVCDRLGIPLVAYSLPGPFKRIYRYGLSEVRGGTNAFTAICHPCHSLLQSQLLDVARSYGASIVYSGCGKKHADHMGAAIEDTVTDDGIAIRYPLLGCTLKPTEIRRMLDRSGVLEWSRSDPIHTNCSVCHLMIHDSLRTGHGNPFSPYFLDPREPEVGRWRAHAMRVGCWLLAKTGLYWLLLRRTREKLSQ